MDYPIDVLFLAPMPEELDPYRSMTDLSLEDPRSDMLHGAEVLYFEIPNAVSGRSIRAAASCVGYGPTDSAVRASELLTTLQPSVVALTGICAADAQDCKKGDVVLCDASWDLGDRKSTYDVNSADFEQVEEYDVRVHEMPRRLREAAVAFAASDLSELEGSFPDRELLRSEWGDDRHDTPLAVHVGAAYSSDVVVVDPPVGQATRSRTFSRLRAIKRSNIAIEMEGVSVARACLNFGVEFLHVRGVQDFGTDETAGDSPDRLVPKATADFYFRQHACKAARTAALRFVERHFDSFFPPQTAVRLRIAQKVDPQKIVEPLAEVELKARLREKIRRDFDQSQISSQQMLLDAHERSVHQLERAHVLPRNVEDRLKPFQSAVSAEALAGAVRPDLATGLSELDAHGIRVSCSAIYPAALATLHSIRTNYIPSLNIDFRAPNSISIVDSLVRDSSADFVVGAEDPMFLSGFGEAATYRRVLVVQEAPQYLFYKELPDNGARVLHIVQGSSGVTQYLSGSGVPDDAIQHVIEFDEVFDRAKSLERGEFVIAWEPLASKLQDDLRLHRLDDSRYNIMVSLYCHGSRWLRTAAGMDLAGCFVECFIAEWNRCRRDIDYAVDQVIEDDDLRLWFAAGTRQ